jgi:molybdopterin molybdotransferase
MDVEIMIHGLRVKPGKHFLMGRSGDHIIGGMPGNPVSSLIMFEVLVKPLLNRLTGMTGKTPGFYVPLENEYVRKTTDTLFFIPVSMTGRGTAVPLEYHGSAHIHSYAKANGIMEVPMGISKISKGEMVYVRPV